MLLQNKYIVHLLMLFGVIVLLSVVTVSSYTIAVGDMAYQKLYLGRVTIVFVICSLISLCLDKGKYFLFISRLVSYYIRWG